MQMEATVSVDEIIHTCTNEKVAQAAVASIGFIFALRVKNAADVHGLSTGAFAAKVVDDFGRRADEFERRAVRRAMDSSQQPILCGLKTILERKIDVESALDHKDRPVSAWSRPASDYGARRLGCGF
jgi:hypothetical protein